MQVCNRNDEDFFATDLIDDAIRKALQLKLTNPLTYERPRIRVFEQSPNRCRELGKELVGKPAAFRFVPVCSVFNFR